MNLWRLLSFRQAYRRVKSVLVRLLLTVACVALGVALVVAFQLMNASVLSSFMDTAEAMAGRASFVVTAGDGLSFGERVAETVRSIEGVKLAVPLVRSTTFPDDQSGDVLTVHGVDLTQDVAVRNYHEATDQAVIGDMIEFLNQPDSVLLTRQFADQRHLTFGSKIALVTPRGVQSFTVRGLLEPSGLAKTLGGRLVVMDLFAAERAFTADGQINQIDVIVHEHADISDVRTTIMQTLPAGLHVEEPELRRELVRKSITAFQAMVSGFSVLAVIAGLVVSYGRLASVFESRTWEIGILRAVGLKQRAILVELLKEGLILGVSGTVLGLLAGVWIGRQALPFLASTTAIAFRQAVPAAHPELPVSAVILGSAVGVVSAIVAASLPALRLSHTAPIVALQMRGREMPIAPTLAKWVARAVVALILAATVAYQLVVPSTLVGLVTTVAIGALACMLATPLVQAGERLLSRPWHLLFGPVGRHAASQLGRHTRRASLIVATLGLGLGVVLLFGMLGWSFELTLEGILKRSLRADLIVTSAHISGGYWSAPLDERLVEEIGSVSGVATVAGEQSKEVAFQDGSVFLKTFDPVAFAAPGIYEWPISAGDASALAAAARGEGVLVTRAFAFAHRTAVGDQIALDSPEGTIVMPVAAVTDAPVENAIVMSRSVYRARWNDPMVSLVHIGLDGTRDPSDVTRDIASRFGEKHSLMVRTRGQIIDYFVDQVRQAFGVLYLMEAVTFILVLLGIGDALISSVVERTREIGMMRAVGLTRIKLFGMVVLEGMTVGVLGLLLALTAGVALGAFWVEVQFPAILGWKIDLHFPTSFAIGAAILTLVLCLLGSLLPSMRASRMSIADALREE